MFEAYAQDTQPAQKPAQPQTTQTVQKTDQPPPPDAGLSTGWVALIGLVILVAVLIGVWQYLKQKTTTKV